MGGQKPTKRDPSRRRQSARSCAGSGNDRGGHESARTQTRDPDKHTKAIWRALESVTDPEIPVINVIEMGMIADVRVEGDRIVVDMTPTFAGCPALEVIRKEIRTAVSAISRCDVTVNVVFEPAWTTDRITEEGRRKLKAFGLAPPGKRCTGDQTPDLKRIPCPFCDSTNTEMESMFGPTLCRSIHYCRDCLQSFEHFKAV